MRRLLSVLALATLPLAACLEEHMTVPVRETALASVSPAGGSVNVDPNGVVTIKFTHPVMTGMEQYAALHEGDVTGPVVAGAWALTSDRTALTFRPASPLKAKTKYTIHLGGGLKDANGNLVDMGPGQMMGGQYASGSMMTGGMMQNAGMMGSGWQGSDGSYGMIFSFTTA
ncbi:MAG TPA: Ig-like domain-containing protein [Longimicrobiales bacterium]